MTYKTIQKAAKKLAQENRAGEPVLLAEVGTLNQFGPTCGFYALYLVLDYWHKTGRSPAPLPPRFRHSASRVRTVSQSNSLRAIGKKINVTTQGTVLSTENLGKVARETGNFDFQNLQTEGKDDFFKQCITHLSKGLPIIIGIDIADSGLPEVRPTPATRQDPNEGGHWAVLCGVQQYENSSPQFIASHWGEYWIWDGDALYDSNNGLNFYPEETFIKKKQINFNFSGTDVTLGGTTYRHGQPYFFNDFDLVHGVVDIEDLGLEKRTVPLTDIEGMRGKLLIVYPRSVGASASSSSPHSLPKPKSRHISIEYE